MGKGVVGAGVEVRCQDTGACRGCLKKEHPLVQPENMLAGGEEPLAVHDSIKRGEGKSLAGRGRRPVFHYGSRESTTR